MDSGVFYEIALAWRSFACQKQLSAEFSSFKFMAVKILNRYSGAFSPEMVATWFGTLGKWKKGPGRLCHYEAQATLYILGHMSKHPFPRPPPDIGTR